MHEQPLTPGRLYDIRLAGRSVAGQVSAIHYQVEINTLEHHAANELVLNAIARCRVELTDRVALDAYAQSPGTGSFIVIDRLSNVTVGAGLIREVVECETVERETAESTAHSVDWAAFEQDLNALVRKHFPHWEARDIRDLLR